MEDMVAKMEAMQVQVAKMEAMRETEKVQMEAMRAQEEKMKETEDKCKKAEERAQKAESNPQSTIILQDIDCMKNVAKKKGKQIYYDNQSATAIQVTLNIKIPDIVFQIILATCQAGKTGCMVSLIENIIKMNLNIDIDNIYIITGLSSKAWELQTRKRMPKDLIKNIIHRAQLKNNVSRFTDLQNAIIIVDECQIACNKYMTFDNLLQQAGIKDLEYLRKNNVNIVEFSATPNTTLCDLELWQKDNAYIKHIMRSGEGYKGFEDLFNEKRIHQAEDLYIDIDKPAGLSLKDEKKHKKIIKPARDAIKKIKEFIEQTYPVPNNHIIRVPTGAKEDVVIGRFKEIFGDSYEYTKCNCTIGKDLVEELIKTPKIHTLIFIKETARCAITFEDINDPKNDVKGRIGVLYERIPKSISDDVIIQGLAGRACGYGPLNNMHVFTNIPSIERYVIMVQSNFENTYDFTWRGKNGKKTTHLHPNGYTENNSMVTEKTKELLDYKIFITPEECQKFRKEVFGGNPGLTKNLAPKTLREKEGENPSVEYLLNRGWGLGGNKQHRCVTTLDDKICVYWKLSYLSPEQENKISKFRKKEENIKV